MGNKPSLSARLEMGGASQDDVYQAILQKCGALPAFKIVDHDDATKTVTLIWQRSALGWKDEVVLVVEADGAVRGRTRSMNVCPNAGICLKPCCGWYGLFSDNGMLCKHLEELADAIGLTSRRTLVEKKGIVKVNGPWDEQQF